MEGQMEMIDRAVCLGTAERYWKVKTFQIYSTCAVVENVCSFQGRGLYGKGTLSPISVTHIQI